jgi:hypothetical protein
VLCIHKQVPDWLDLILGGLLVVEVAAMNQPTQSMLAKYRLHKYSLKNIRRFRVIARVCQSIGEPNSTPAGQQELDGRRSID